MTVSLSRSPGEVLSLVRCWLDPERDLPTPAKFADPDPGSLPVLFQSSKCTVVPLYSKDFSSYSDNAAKIGRVFGYSEALERQSPTNPGP